MCGKGHKTWVRIPGPPCYFTIFFLAWSDVCTGTKTIMDHQLATIGSKADQIQRPSHEGLPCILVNVQHGNQEGQHWTKAFGLRLLLAPPFLFWHQAQFLSFFSFYIFFYLIILIKQFSNTNLIFFLIKVHKINFHQIRI